jgi:hypothetical protein
VSRKLTPVYDVPHAACAQLYAEGEAAKAINIH